MTYARDSAAITVGPAAGQQTRLFDEVRRRLRIGHYSLRTEQVYVAWMRRFIQANARRHPRDMGGPEVEAFLSSLAVQGASEQAPEMWFH